MRRVAQVFPRELSLSLRHQPLGQSDIRLGMIAIDLECVRESFSRGVLVPLFARRAPENVVGVRIGRLAFESKLDFLAHGFEVPHLHVGDGRLNQDHGLFETRLAPHAHHPERGLELPRRFPVAADLQVREPEMITIVGNVGLESSSPGKQLDRLFIFARIVALDSGSIELSGAILRNRER